MLWLKAQKYHKPSPSMITGWRWSSSSSTEVHYQQQPSLLTKRLTKGLENQPPHSPPHHSSVGELNTLYQDKEGSVQSLLHHHTAIWEWHVDNVDRAGKETELIPLALLMPRPEHILERQSTQYGSPVPYWSPIHVYPA